MTAKEKLREVVDEMTEDEAGSWLATIAPAECGEPGVSPLAEMFAAIFADVPIEELATLAPSDQVDSELEGFNRLLV